MIDKRESPPRAVVLPAGPVVDFGLRSYMLRIYNKLALGLALSAGVALAVSATPAIRDLLFKTPPGQAGAPLAALTGLGLVVVFAPLLILAGFGSAGGGLSARRAGLVYWSVSAAMGGSLATLFLAFPVGSITAALALAAASFAVLSLVGYAVGRNLGALGSFLTVGLVGLVFAVMLNVFLQSSLVFFLVNAVGVLVFAGLIAFDTQRLKLLYAEVAGEPEKLSAATSLGALCLYLNFIALFQFLLLMLAGRR